MKNLFFLFITAIMASGCASVQLSRIGEEPTKRLNPDGSVYVMIPDNGVYNNKVYKVSGKITANCIVSAFLKHAKRVEMSEGVETFETGLANVQNKGFMYLVQPQILHWEDRATEWSGVTDKVEVKISIFEAAAGVLLDAVIVKGHSGWLTFGGDHPEDLLVDTIANYVASLYGVK